MLIFRECTLSNNAASNVNKDELTETLALCEIDGQEIIHVFSPDRSWTSVHAAAREIEADVVSVLVRVQYEFLPEMSLLTAFNELTTMPTGQFTQESKNVIDENQYKPYDLSPFALRKFSDSKLTQFMGLSPVGTNKVVKVFKRGTPREQLVKTAMIIEADIVWVRARASFTIDGMARMERRFSELRQVN